MREDWTQPGDFLYEYTMDRTFNRQPMIQIKPQNTSAPACWSPVKGWYRDDDR